MRNKFCQQIFFIIFLFFCFYIYTGAEAPVQVSLTYSTHSSVLGYPFTDPTNTPFTKYFWRKGYTTRMGTVVTMIVAYLMISFNR